MPNKRRRGQQYTLRDQPYSEIASLVDRPQMCTSKRGYAYLVGRSELLGCDVSIHYAQPYDEVEARFVVRWPHLDYTRKTTLEEFPTVEALVAFMKKIPHGGVPHGG